MAGKIRSSRHLLLVTSGRCFYSKGLDCLEKKRRGSNLPKARFTLT